MIPANPILEAAVSSLRLSPEHDRSRLERIEVVPPDFIRDGSQHAQASGIEIWFDPAHGVSYAALQARVQKALAASALPASPRLADIVLAMSPFRPPTMRGLDACNAIIASSTETPCLLVSVLRVLLPFGAQFGEFSIGRLDFHKFASKCRKIGSDYAVKYQRELNRNTAITRSRYSLKVLQVNFPPEHVNLAISLLPPTQIRLWRDLVERYYAEVATLQFERFWYEYAETQELPTALGYDIFPADIARTELFRGLHNIALLESIGTEGKGWVSGATPSMGITMTAPRDRAAIAFLNQNGIELPIKWQEPSNSFYPAIRSYAKFMVKGIEHWRFDRTSEAFLHLMIALDLLFGEQGSSTDSISRRAAVCAAPNLPTDLKDSERTIKDLYDARSKYVHAGESPTISHYERALEVCRQTMHVLIRAQRTFQLGFSKWKATLDMLSFAIAAGAALPSIHALEEAGLRIAPPPDPLAR